MSEEERAITIINDIKRDIEEIISRNSSVTSNTNMTLESSIDDIKTIPEYIIVLKKNLEELKQANQDLEEKIMQTNQAIETVTTEIEIGQNNKQDLEKTEVDKRSKKQELETNISSHQNEKGRLEQELQHLSSSASNKEEAYKQLQEKSRLDLVNMDQQILESQSILETAKEDNKLIVYLMDAGLMDVPEAEIVSAIAASKEGLTIEELKQKVNIPSVRVQPTLNNLLEKILTYEPRREVYMINPIIQEELNK